MWDRRWSLVVGRRSLAAVVAASVAGFSVAHAQQQAPGIAEGRLARMQAAVDRALFAAEEPLAMTLIADFKAINRDRSPESTKTFPATLVVAGRTGGEDRLDVRIRTRGHVRRLNATCTFAPLRIEFSGLAAGTVFEGHKSLKLGTHCRDVDSYEQYVYREYLAYKIFNLVTPRSFRARLAKASYVDLATGKPLGTRAGLFIEDDDDVAKRLDGRTTALQGNTFASVDQETIALVALFEYMIGNTDMSLYKLHNIVLVRAATGLAYPVPYDFDYSGLVDARYAVAAKSFGLANVRERLYLGPCLTAEQFGPLLARLRGVREAVVSLYDGVPALGDGYRKDAVGYLDQFFRLIDKPSDVKRTFIDGCTKRSTM